MRRRGIYYWGKIYEEPLKPWPNYDSRCWRLFRYCDLDCCISTFPVYTLLKPKFLHKRPCRGLFWGNWRLPVKSEPNILIDRDSNNNPSLKYMRCIDHQAWLRQSKNHHSASEEPCCVDIFHVSAHILSQGSACVRWVLHLASAFRVCGANSGYSHI